MLKYIGNFFSITGAFILAYGFVKTGYCFFIVGSGAWLIVGYIQKDKQLQLLNYFFLAADFVGLYKAIFLK